MRLKPAAYLIPRNSLVETEINGVKIARGDLIFMSPYLVHHDKDLWKDPEVFDPSRFQIPNPLHHYNDNYIPFGMGPHKCIGMNLAIIEAARILCRITSRYSFEPVTQELPENLCLVTLRPDRSILTKIRKK